MTSSTTIWNIRAYSSIMEHFLSIYVTQFTPRELAMMAWGGIIFVWAIQKEPIRKSLKALVKVMIHPKILMTLFLMAIYISLMIFVLYSVELWNASTHLNATIIWAVFVALSMVVNVAGSMKDERFFRKTVLSTVSITVMIDFFVNLFPFTFIVEFLLVIPVAFVLGSMLAIVETDQRFANLKRPLNGLVAIFGLVLLVRVLWSLLSNLTILDTGLFTDFALPSALTLMFLPFIYCLALVLSYSTLFFRLAIQNRGSPLLRYAKLKSLHYFGFNLSKLNRWLKTNFRLKFDSKDEINKQFS